ncbi:DNA replication licensing factor MCM3 isoform X2 [Hydra vulgaris]|uniref:DNA replication licensing factor MCM3 n=1 Tax=Hydra vulgaris TaxID=6087 RepID=A0ABM4BS96_HYDVU
MDVIIDQNLRDIQRQYLDFLDDDADQGFYHSKVCDMIERNDCRLIVNLNDLRSKNEERAKNLLNEAFEELIGFQNALKEFVSSTDTTYAKKFEEFFVGFEGSFGSKHVSPRTLSARNLGNLVCCEGIVTKCSLVSPKVVKSVHYCPRTKKMTDRRYTDLTSLSAFPSSTVYPTKDDDGNPLETEYGLSIYKDHQNFTIQEMPEKAPAGQLPRSVDIVVDNDLVDKCKPGDRIQVIGIYRCLPSKSHGFTPGTFRTILIANNIKVMSKEVAPTFSPEDLTNIKKFSRSKEDVFELLAHSLAPSIHGHTYIKKAILCLLLGGTEKNLDNGTRLRGDINIMMIGDPSTAKSQLLRYVLHTAPRAIATTGRGSSGVGLTAAVTTDQETGDRILEAGAMVLADRGVVCIDEFDKMSDMDRTAIHEVMEQGRVTIAKAGIHAKLNARCSVLAAANPVYGRYDPYKTPMDNIGMQDSLLSRFDLLFIVLDNMDPESDRKISEHVLRMHRYRNPGEQDGEPLPFGDNCETLSTFDAVDAQQDDEEVTRVYAKKDSQLYGEGSKKEKFVSIPFMKKYIHVAKNIKPVLSKPAIDLIVNAYADLRDQDDENATGKCKTAPVTARTLETLIRLSTAHAKARMSKTIESVDAESAIEMVEFAYFHKVEQRTGKKKKNEEKRGSGSDSESEVEHEVQQKKRKKKISDNEDKKTKKMKLVPGDEGYDPFDFDLQEVDSQVEALSSKHDQVTVSGTETVDAVKTKPIITEARFQTFRSSLQSLFSSEHAQTLPLLKVVEKLARDYPDSKYSKSEIDAAVERMTEDNHIMLSDGHIFLV